MDKMTLYDIGIQAVKEFLDHNSVTHPIFMTYEEALSKKSEAYPFKLLETVSGGALQGTGTGLYSRGYVFVNVSVTALPVQRPSMRNWSWPGWKTDRTAVGVVAHEVGHYLAEEVSRGRSNVELRERRAVWLDCIRGKKVSGYEPVPGEAAAETLRLFILNPDLLRLAIPKRYNFMRSLGLKALPRLLQKGYAAVLNNAAYLEAAQRYIG